jgi:hypothetical protein
MWLLRVVIVRNNTFEERNVARPESEDEYDFALDCSEAKDFGGNV